jgi:hypothetical protein
VTVPRGCDDDGGSTTYVWKKVKVSSGARREQRAAGAPSRAAGRRRDRNELIHLRIRYRGGPESKWTVWVGEFCWVFPGYIGLDDVMARMLGEVGW